jgi:hypothetical protein
MNDLLHSKGFRAAAFILGGLVIYFAGFAVGVNVGERKERHFENRNANFEGMFVPRPGANLRGPLPIGGAPLMPPAHGAFGKVVSVVWPSVIISTPEETEQEVVASTSTRIRTDRGTGTEKDVAAGAEIAVFGSPNGKGQIEADLIRIMGAGNGR